MKSGKLIYNLDQNFLDYKKNSNANDEFNDEKIIKIESIHSKSTNADLESEELELDETNMNEKVEEHNDPDNTGFKNLLKFSPLQETNRFKEKIEILNNSKNFILDLQVLKISTVIFKFLCFFFSDF